MRAAMPPCDAFSSRARRAPPPSAGAGRCPVLHPPHAVHVLPFPVAAPQLSAPLRFVAPAFASAPRARAFGSFPHRCSPLPPFCARRSSRFSSPSALAGVGPTASPQLLVAAPWPRPPFPHFAPCAPPPLRHGPCNATPSTPRFPGGRGRAPVPARPHRVRHGATHCPPPPRRPGNGVRTVASCPRRAWRQHSLLPPAPNHHHIAPCNATHPLRAQTCSSAVFC
mmetsp:Transcript_14553/g.49283  ORF Transcript_14553/g.49283 Transcript_14553/m.49283 type:complete len:224 (+) Transcript_14553:129-800(+)